MRVFGTIAVCCAVLTAAVAAQSQTPAAPQPRPLPTLVVEVQTIFNNIKSNMTKAADQFPEDKYGWSPTPDVRTWGGLLSHIIDDNNGACFLLAGETAAQPRLDSGGKPTDAGKGMTKAAIVTALADSFARCDKAFAAVTTENMLERNGTGNRSKIGALIYDTQHINEHYGNIVTYMRLQGMVPPSSAPRGGGD
jgi:hypothetical protein